MILQYYNNWRPAWPLSSRYSILYDDPKWSHEDSYLWCGNDSRSRKERPVAAYCSTVLSWAELKWSWNELEVHWLWWEQALFKYCSSRYTGQLNWVLMYHGTLLPAPNEPGTTIFKIWSLSISVFLTPTTVWLIFKSNQRLGQLAFFRIISKIFCRNYFGYRNKLNSILLELKKPWKVVIRIVNCKDALVNVWKQDRDEKRQEDCPRFIVSKTTRQ